MDNKYSNLSMTELLKLWLEYKDNLELVEQAIKSIDAKAAEKELEVEFLWK